MTYYELCSEYQMDNARNFIFVYNFHNFKLIYTNRLNL